MSRRLLAIFVFLFSIFFAAFSAVASAQTQMPAAVPGSPTDDLREFFETPAVSGYEDELVSKIRAKLTAFHPVMDNLGNIVITLGSGSPHRLIVTPIDEPGFVVSGITEDGYLRVQRLPQGGLPPIFNELYAAQPVKVRTSTGKWIDGVFAGLSVHLQPSRTNPPKSSDIENMFVDIGATS
ncbi:MAG TPA: peptidase M42, partial [Candidatus Limnocylindria bacterium]|nr:peptidase M42 [Candidatus Limnocylindria bacterium]